MISLAESVVLEFLMRYGERALYVLKAAVEVSEEYRLSGRNTPGDFDNKGLLRKLRMWGINYNPTQLLRAMERDYGIVETSYRTTTQRWWTFSNKEAVITALRSFEGGEEGVDDPEEYVVDLQIRIINIDKLYNALKAINFKKKLNAADKDFIKRVVMVELPTIARVLKEALKYEGKYRDFIRKAQLVLKLTGSLTKRLISGDSTVRDVEILNLKEEASMSEYGETP